jgi:hypothetical protein
MNTPSLPYEILIRAEGGLLRGAAAYDLPGSLARAVSADELAIFGPAINAAAMARIAELEADLAALKSTPIPKTSEHPENRKIWPNSAAFLSEFTMPELAAISLSLDPTIAALRLLLASWPADIYSDDPRIIGGLSSLVAAGIITEARRGEILAK